ncbi:MAG: diguanylate cyclase, partial [Desulfuromonadaceae bacterium]
MLTNREKIQPEHLFAGADDGFFARLRRQQVLFTDPVGRLRLVARARWWFMALVTLYGISAGILYAVSKFGFFPDRGQVVLLSSSLAIMVLYNVFSPRLFQHRRHYRPVSWFQIGLDLIFVTLLVYFSGGGASWFWPVYLLVTLEGAVLIEDKRSVRLLGIFGGGLYGALLLLTYFRVIPFIPMPFVDASLHYDGFYLLLMWCWVSLLNSIVALLGSYLMAVIRGENLAVRESEERLLRFLDSANDLIFSVNSEGTLLYANRSWKETLEFEPTAEKPVNIEKFLYADDLTRCAVEMKQVVESKASRSIEGRLVSRSGALIDVEGNLTFSHQEGSVGTVWGICRDVTSRKRAQSQLYHMAHHDMLTSLPNRLFFIDRLQHANAMARRQQKQIAVLFLDLDRFKIINDTLGHSIGDILLQSVADRLKGCVREVDTVARLGGDEFTVLLSNISGAEDVEPIAGKIL